MGSAVKPVTLLGSAVFPTALKVKLVDVADNSKAVLKLKTSIS